MTPRPARARLPRRRGMTLVEVALSTVVVGVMFAAAMQTVAASRKGERITADRGRAQALASDLLEEILDKAYADSNDSPTVFGPTGAEAATGNRSLFNDVNDYRNWTETPPKRTDGTNLDGLTGWQRKVTIQFLNPANYAAVVSTDQGVARIIVQVIRGGEIARLAAIRTSGLPATQACKLGGGACADLVAARCTAIGGSPQGVGTSCWTLPDNYTRLVAHWKMDENSGSTAADSAGTHTATLINTPGWTTGRFGNALLLDGTNEYAVTPHVSDLSINKQITLTAWVRLENVTAGVFRYVINKGTTVGGPQNYYLTTIGNQILVGYYDGQYRDFVTTTAGLVRRQWYHIAATLDADAGVARIFLNGSPIFSGTMTAPIPTNTESLYIGRSEWADDFFFGRLDDVRVYDGIVTDADIVKIFNGTL